MDISPDTSRYIQMLFWNSLCILEISNSVFFFCVWTSYSSDFAAVPLWIAQDDRARYEKEARSVEAVWIERNGQYGAPNSGTLSLAIATCHRQTLGWASGKRLHDYGKSPFSMGKPTITGWWFGTFFIFPYIGDNHPNNWLSYFSGGWNHQPDNNGHFQVHQRVSLQTTDLSERGTCARGECAWCLN